MHANCTNGFRHNVEVVIDMTPGVTNAPESALLQPLTKEVHCTGNTTHLHNCSVSKVTACRRAAGCKNDQEMENLAVHF